MRLALLLLFAGAARAQTVSMWPVDSLVKIFRDDAVGTSRAEDAPWLVARNGHASLQFALRSNSPLTAVRATVAIDGALTAEARRVGYVPVHANVPDTAATELVHVAPAKFPDPLFEEGTFTIPGNETTALWITVFAPASTTPGAYKGNLTLRVSNADVAVASFRIRVTEATVPAKQTLKVSNWFYFDEAAMSPYFDVKDKPEKLWELLGNISRVAAEHKQNVFLTPVLSLTDAHRNAQQQIEYDFPRLDRFVDIVTTAGAMELIEGSHLIERAGGYDGPLKVPVLDVDPSGAVTRQQLDPDDPRAAPRLTSFLTALYAHLQEKGWLDRYVQHVLDEPHGKEPPVYLRYAKLIHAALPGVRTIDAFDQPSGEWVGSACDIRVLQLGKCDSDIETARAEQAWFYTCLFPRGAYPNRFIDFPLLKTRLLHWLNFRYGLSGYLHWGGDSWGANPYEVTELGLEVGAPVGGALPAGDAFVTYPWREKNSIHSSIRFEAMRDGIEDYELLHALAARQPEKAMRIAKKAVPSFTGYVRDVTAFRKLQAELLTSAP